MQRDPIDRRYRERLGASYLVSIGLHAVLAAFLFSVASSASEEGASESITGATVVSVERVAAVAPAPQPVVPVPHAPTVAPIRHAPVAQPQQQPFPPAHHELTKFAPTAPPNPTPVPQASVQPNPAPTQPVYEPQPQNALPAVPRSEPSAAAVAVTITAAPTLPPTPVPTVAPTLPPTPRPQPTARPSISPSPVPPVVAVRATTAPSATPAPAPASTATAKPTATPGVPSPSPTKAALIAHQTGAAPSPAPSGHASPGPVPGSGAVSKAGPARPVTVRPTPTPATVATAPKPSPSSGGYDINAKLRALLPHNPVNPVFKSYHETVSLGPLGPTPPPEILAATKFIYEENGTGGDAKVKMWVTGTHRNGPLLVCDGWMLRYPRSSQPAFQEGTQLHPVQGNILVTTGGEATGTLPPIVEASASISCKQSALVPFAPSAAASP
jgi:hypothetical protein